VPLVVAAPATLALAQRKDADEPLVDHFVRLATEVAAIAARSAATPYSSV